MNKHDKALGMGRDISRRDFVHGATMAAGAVAAAGAAIDNAQAQTLVGARTPENYPPLKQGLRGFHPGSFEPIHSIAWQGGKAPPAAEATGEVYDLVVVGAGLSGLCAAWLYRKKAGPSAKILVVDNLNGFGGHAQRAEFTYGGKTLYTGAGSGYMVSPSDWSDDAKTILKDLGWDRKLADGRDSTSDLYRRLGLRGAVYFPKERYGADKIVIGAMERPTPEFLAQTPMSAEMRESLARLMLGKEDYMPGMSVEEKTAALRKMSYRDYLLNVVKLNPEIVKMNGGVWCLGSDVCSAWFAFFRGQPGFAGLGLTVPDKSPESEEARKDDFSMPGSNSDIARLIVRLLIPDSLPAGDFVDLADKRVDYSVLDRETNNTRIRSDSIVYSVKHVGAPAAKFEPEYREVEISYLRAGKAVSVKAKNVVLACMNNVIPTICPDMPEIQKKALKQAVRAVNQGTSVLFRNWKAWDKLKLNGVSCPHSFYGRVGLGSQRKFGNVVPSQSPDDPIIVGFATGGNSGILNNPYMVEDLCNGKPPALGSHPDDQFRAVRMALLGKPFSYFERHVRELATRVLAGSDFDPARDIVGINVNRWAHGFATGRNELFDKTEPGELSPTIVARQKFGRIAIANSDSGGVSTMQTAFDQATRAINDLELRAYGFYESI